MAGGRFRELLKKYGKVALGVHFSVSAASITGLYVAINNNVDVESLLAKVGMKGVEEKTAQKEEQSTIQNPPQSNLGTSDGFVVEETAAAAAAVKKRNRTAELAASSGGALALAVLCNKALFPIRVPITIALTPPIARFLARRQIIKNNDIKANVISRACEVRSNVSPLETLPPACKNMRCEVTKSLGVKKENPAGGGNWSRIHRLGRKEEQWRPVKRVTVTLGGFGYNLGGRRSSSGRGLFGPLPLPVGLLVLHPQTAGVFTAYILYMLEEGSQEGKTLLSRTLTDRTLDGSVSDSSSDYYSVYANGREVLGKTVDY
ncbi:hypothetical protein C3L33_19488, partial [Rhododendron williamsianum]